MSGFEIKVRWLPSVAGQSDDFSNAFVPDYVSEENEKLDIAFPFCGGSLRICIYK